MGAKPKDNKDINFEDTIKEIEDIVNELENGKLNLDESLLKFEAGMKLSKECSKILENAEKKITMLIEQNGEIKEEIFLEESEANDK